MDPLTLSLLGVAIVPAAVQMFRSLYRIIEKVRDEAVVDKRLGETFSKDVRNGISSLLRDQELLQKNPQALLAAQRIIEETIKDMDEKTQQSIKEGLYQNKRRSQIEYVARVLDQEELQKQPSSSNAQPVSSTLTAQA